MATTLHLYVRGLYAALPWREGTKTGADIALVNAQRAGHPAHAALLRVHSGRAEVTGDPGRGSERQWRVEGRAIRIGNAVSKASGLALVPTDESYPWQGLKWILAMRVIAPYCKPRPDVGIGGDGRVSAALRIVDGTLEGNPPSHGKLGLWSTSKGVTALSDSVLHTASFEGRAVEFQFANLEANGKLVGTIHIVPNENQTDVVVSLTNLPAAEHRHKRGDIAHVSAAYDLFEDVPKDAPVPAFVGLIDRVPSPVESDDDPPNCIPVFHPLPPDPPPMLLPQFPTFGS